MGARGYMFGCMDDPQTRLEHSLRNAAYADNMSILTNKLSDLKVQADKLTLYSDWAHMKVNTGKTLVSGVLYQNIRTGQYGNKDSLVQVRRQLENQIAVQGQCVQYLFPLDPFRYLGAVLTMTLDWKFQHQHLISKARKKTDELLDSYKSRISSNQQ